MAATDEWEGRDWSLNAGSGRSLLATLSLYCYLNVDVVATVLDDLDIGVVDGLFIVFDTSRPIRCRAKDLTGSRKSVKVHKGDASCSLSSSGWCSQMELCYFDAT